MTKLEGWCIDIIKSELEYSSFLSEQALFRIATKCAKLTREKICNQVADQLKNIYLPANATKVIGDINKIGEEQEYIK